MKPIEKIQDNVTKIMEAMQKGSFTRPELELLSVFFGRAKDVTDQLIMKIVKT